MSKADLRVDWASAKAATYACENWHYSGCMPIGKLVKIGAWESGRFIGVVIFGRGTSPMLGRAYGLNQTTCVELVRVALRDHRAQVSRIVALSLRLLRQRCPRLRLVVSFASQDAGHHGGIYQAGGWVYSGTTSPYDEFSSNGVRLTSRAVRQMVKETRVPVSQYEKSGKLRRLPTTPKHRYLMPLDAEIREQIAVLSKPYPKRAGSTDSGTPAVQAGGGGATPTSALISEANHE